MPASPTPASLLARIADEIRASGPLPLDRFMALALLDPAFGYYRHRDPLGAAGDFATAPEISQMFGEIVGLWLAGAWDGLGRPKPVRLVELGPGRGTLMTDLLRAATAVPGFHDALDLHLVEASPVLRARQQERLAGYAPVWHARLADVPGGPVLLIANEFVDALPVRQLVRTARGWVERRVGLGDQRLAFVVPDDTPPEALDVEAPEGAITEVAPVRDALAREIGSRICRDGGVALLIDYGARAEGATGDTLQALFRQQPADPLARPGEADLSAQVDFGAFARAAQQEGARVFGPVPQGTFLRAFGIEARAVRLMERAVPDQRRAIRQALFRLLDPSQMGELFKVLVISAGDAPPPPGFSTGATP